MRIWHLIDTLEVGGAETMVATLCQHQRDAGLSPSVHCVERGGEIADQLEEQGIPVHIHGVSSLVRLSFRLARMMKKLQPQVIHCHNASAAIAGAPAAYMAGLKAVIATRHGLVPPDRYFRREVKFWLAARFCTFVVAVCQTARQNLMHGPLAIPEKVVTIYNSAAPAGHAAAPGVGKAPLCRPGEFSIVNVARHSKEKDLETLLSAFAQARQQVPSLRLILAGNGVRTPDLKRYAEELNLQASISFLGERRDVGFILSQASLFVLSSVSEGLPISLLEAMAAGVPQVVTRVGGMPEIVEMSRGGSVVPPRDPGALAEAILRFVADEQWRRHCGEKARECYERNFTPRRMAEDYYALYTQAMGQG